jgi:hypothetical protein
MEACVGAHHLSGKVQMLGHDARLMPAKYVRPYSKGQKNDFRDAEAIAEAVQRPTKPGYGSLGHGRSCNVQTGVVAHPLQRHLQRTTLFVLAWPQSV